MKRIIATLSWCLATALVLSAQIQPPGLQCVSSETIQWTLPANTCGAFQNYQLWFSTDINGPYSNLAVITDPAQTSYVHPNPSNQVYYYYMYTEADCPGEPTIFSDTITNNNPNPAPITHVTVENGHAVVYWEPSTTDPLQGYIVYRLVGLNVDPVDTIFLGPGVNLQYEDLNAQPGTQPEQYYILALDDCGNTSIFLDPHITIYADGSVSACERSLTVNWNGYEGWDNGVDFQEIWMTADGVNYTTFVVGDTTSTYTFTDDLIEGEEYCFYIEAVEVGTGIRSRSNVFCQVFEISAPLQDYALTGVGFTDDGAVVRVDWQWDAGSDLSDYTVLRTVVGSDVVDLIGPFDASSNLTLDNSYFDQTVNPDVGPWQYSLEVQDACGGLSEDRVFGRTIFAEGEALPNGGSQLYWTPMELSDAEVLRYEIYKESLTGFSYLGSTDAETYTLFDSYDPVFRNVSDIQYYVVGQASLLLPDSSRTLVRSRSNTVAIDQRARISAPNVFAPDGVNNIFQPFVLQSEDTQYHLQIFNRWGAKVFESRDLSVGWDGRCEGVACPQGVYVYWIRLVQANGRVVHYEGDVLLLR